MPTNTFGPNDNYDTKNSHFIPALIKKVHIMKKSGHNSISLWGDGSPKREIIYVDDIADACIYFIKKKTKHVLINIGTGKDFSIKAYLKMILKVSGLTKKIKIKFDKSKPNGTQRKVLDISRAKSYGWSPKSDIMLSLKKTYKNFENNNLK